MKKNPTVVAAIIIIIGVVLIFIYSLQRNKITEDASGTFGLSPGDSLPFPESEPYLVPPTTRPPNP